MVDKVVKVDLNKFQKSWKAHTTTEVVMHMFRKLPEVIQTAKETEGEAMKGAKSILRSNTKVSCTVALANAEKKSYFMHYDNIPARVRISNPSLTKIKEATAVLEQDVFHRLKTRSKGVHFVRMVLWECKLKIDPTQKDCIVPIDVTLQAKKLTPTVLRQMQTLIYVKHSIRVKLKLKDLSDVTVRLPLVIMEPPVEHLAKALRKRYLEANREGTDKEAEKIISSLSEEVTTLRQQQEEILQKLELQQLTQQELLEQQQRLQQQPRFPPQQLEVDPSEDSAGYTESSASASASASEEPESRRVHAEQLGMPPERHQPMSTVVEDFEDGSCLVLASSEDYYRSLNA